MGARDEILRTIRRHQLAAAELPDPGLARTRFPDLETQFQQSLAAVGGRAITAASLTDAAAALESLPAWASSRKSFSAVSGLGRSTFAADDVAAPHAFEDVDCAIVRGWFGVAENGAVWVTDAGLRHRSICFLAQHLVLAVPRGEIVATMHDAYERPELSDRFEEGRFGMFVSGPSKTADIEQSLVIGAHGPRSLTVLLIDGPF